MKDSVQVERPIKGEGQNVPRSLRVQYFDAVYHVMNRGNNRQNIFGEDKEYQKFLLLLELCCVQFNVKLFAFCLMPNHYHLLLRTPNANIAEFMKHLNATYAQWLNNRRGQDGHVFQGRYKAILVESDRYLLGLVRYIHRNPVEASLVFRVEDYRYSSYNWYLRPNFAEWFDSLYVLQILSQGILPPLETYKKWMDQPVENEISTFYQRKKHGSYLGSPSFKENKGQALGPDP